MISANYDMMTQAEAKFCKASGLASRDNYSIFYGPLNKCPLLMINANPGGSPANYKIVDVMSGEHEYIEGRDSGPTTRNGAEILTALTGGTSQFSIRDVQVLNRFFHRSSSRPNAVVEARYMAEAMPVLADLIQYIEPKVIIFGGDSGVNLFASSHGGTTSAGPAMMGPNGRSEAVYLREYQLRLPYYRPVTAFGIYHPSKLNSHFRQKALPVLRTRVAQLLAM